MVAAGLTLGNTCFAEDETGEEPDNIEKLVTATEQDRIMIVNGEVHVDKNYFAPIPASVVSSAPDKRVYINLTKYEDKFGNDIRAGRRMGFGDDTIIKYLDAPYFDMPFHEIEELFGEKIKQYRENGDNDDLILYKIYTMHNVWVDYKFNKTITPTHSPTVANIGTAPQVMPESQADKIDSTADTIIGIIMSGMILFVLVLIRLIWINLLWERKNESESKSRSTQNQKHAHIGVADEETPVSIIERQTVRETPNNEFQNLEQGKKLVSDYNRNKVVYCHRRKTNNVPFYIGLGSIKRAYNFKKRNNKWHQVFQEHGCKVEILHQGLTPDEAAAIEIRLIREYRKEFPGQMTNISDGGETGTTNYRRRAYR